MRQSLARAHATWCNACQLRSACADQDSRPLTKLRGRVSTDPPNIRTVVLTAHYGLLGGSMFGGLHKEGLLFVRDGDRYQRWYTFSRDSTTCTGCPDDPSPDGLDDLSPDTSLQNRVSVISITTSLLQLKLIRNLIPHD
jgi:hypothetical protein